MLFTPHPARRLQQRLPRETFTRRLSRICEALDRCSRMVIRSKLPRLSPEYVETEVEIDHVWAAGSYGRGASHCADLDLVVRVRRVSGSALPDARTIARAFFGATPLVHFVIGEPNHNNMGLQLDAVEIWSPVVDWRSRILAIRLDPQAGAAPRPTDVFPLRPLQVYFDDIRWYERIAELHQQQVWTSEFREISEEADELVLPEGIPPLRVGKQTRRLLPPVIRLLKAMGCDLRQLAISPETGEIRAGGVYVLCGRPSVPRALSLLEQPRFAVVMLVPHFSREGPNGAWFLRRGHQHRLVQAFERLGAWGVMDGELLLHGVDDARHGATVAELFTQEAAADRACFEDGLHARWLQGRELLDALAGADYVSVDGEELSVPFGAGLTTG